MKFFDGLIGNEKLKKTVGYDIFSDTQSHAYILEGPDGSGRHTAAKEICASLMCKNRKAETFPCGKCSSCMKVANGVSTDVIFVGRDDTASLGVDKIRTIKETISFAPTEEERKVYVIEDAERMTVQAQNSLLLSLEEPPEFVSFVLLCTDSSALLETVRSRAPVIRMEQFPVRTLIDILKKRNLCPTASEDALFNAAVVSEGAIGKAEELLAGESREALQTVATAKEILPILLSNRSTEKLSLLNVFPKKRDELILCLSYLVKALRDLAAIKKGAGELLFFSDRGEAEALSRSAGISRIFSLESEIVSAIDKINSNVNAQPVLMLLITKK